MITKPRILIASPIRQKATVLKSFLDSLMSLELEDYEPYYFFIDDNVEETSHELLNHFKKSNNNVLLKYAPNDEVSYDCNNTTHQWNNNLIWKVARFKDEMIEHAKANNFDYLFFIDSDLVLKPKTLKHLVETKKDIISEVFWTKWYPNQTHIPQVWLKGHYLKPTSESAEFIQKLRTPGVYEVGGLGACTLLSKHALEKGVCFREISNLDMTGEDRHFCVRANVLGLKLWVDTHYPALHLYRDEDLNSIEDYKAYHSPILFHEAVEVKKLLKSFIENFYAYDYHFTSPYGTMEHLSLELINQYSQKAVNLSRFYIKNKIVCKCEVEKIEVIQVNEKYTSFKAKSIFYVSTGKTNIKVYGEFDIVYANFGYKINKIILKQNQFDLTDFTLKDIIVSHIRKINVAPNKLTIGLLVRNEANKRLKEVLEKAQKYADEFVILDDCSTDNTVDICKSVINKPLTIHSNKAQQFGNEIVLRKQLWEMIVKTKPDWIMILDADEIVEASIGSHIESLINQSSFDNYAFRLYDMWDEAHYREDEYWYAHKIFRIFLTRYQSDFDYEWLEQAHHCGRFPHNIGDLPTCKCNLRIKHFGWADEDIRKSKYERYMKYDPEGIYGIKKQYESILDAKPHLVEADF